MRDWLLFVLFTLPFSTSPASAQDTRDWYLHPFAGFMQLFGDGTVDQGFPFRDNAEGMDLLYGVRGGRRVIGRLELEGGFRFSLADRQTVGVFAEEDYSISEPLYGRLVFLNGGNLFVSDLGFKWNLGRKKLSAFLYAGTGSVSRTQAASLDTLILLDILARQQNQRFIWRDLPLRHRTAYHLDFGAGGEISMGRRWGLRFEARDRIEPNSYPDKARHFVEVTAGPSFRF